MSIFGLKHIPFSMWLRHTRIRHIRGFFSLPIVNVPFMDGGVPFDTSYMAFTYPS